MGGEDPPRGRPLINTACQAHLVGLSQAVVSLRWSLGLQGVGGVGWWWGGGGRRFKV